MVLKRSSPYLKEKGYLPDTIFGFRTALVDAIKASILLQIKEEIIGGLGANPKSAILALDVNGAFDNVFHEAVL